MKMPMAHRLIAWDLVSVAAPASWEGVPGSDGAFSGPDSEDLVSDISIPFHCVVWPRRGPLAGKSHNAQSICPGDVGGRGDITRPNGRARGMSAYEGNCQYLNSGSWVNPR
jgi:hypothetical protein